MKRDIRISELFESSAIYDNNYTYNGFVIVNNDNRFDWVSSYTAATPLETVRVHTLIECPKEVAENKKNPISVFLEVSDGTIYQYDIRK